MIIDDGDEEISRPKASKKRALVEDSDEENIEQQGKKSVVIVEKIELPKAQITPNKASAKKSKVDDGKTLSSTAGVSAAPANGTASVQKMVKEAAEEIKESAPLNIGPPKDIEKLRPPSSLQYDPI